MADCKTKSVARKLHLDMAIYFVLRKVGEGPGTADFCGSHVFSVLSSFFRKMFPIGQDAELTNLSQSFKVHMLQTLDYCLVPTFYIPFLKVSTTAPISSPSVQLLQVFELQ